MNIYWTPKATEVKISAAVRRIYHTQHNSLLQTRASTEQLKKGFAELHLGPHLMSFTPWNCLFRAWLSAHSAFRNESSSSSSSFCGREGREAVRDTAWALSEQLSSEAPKEHLPSAPPASCSSTASSLFALHHWSQAPALELLVLSGREIVNVADGICDTKEKLLHKDIKNLSSDNWIAQI